MTDIVERLRANAAAVESNGLPVPGAFLLDAAAEIVRLRLRLSDLETSIAAFRQTVNEWEW